MAVPFSFSHSLFILSTTKLDTKLETDRIHKDIFHTGKIHQLILDQTLLWPIYKMSTQMTFICIQTVEKAIFIPISIDDPRGNFRPTMAIGTPWGGDFAAIKVIHTRVGPFPFLELPIEVRRDIIRMTDENSDQAKPTWWTG